MPRSNGAFLRHFFDRPSMIKSELIIAISKQQPHLCESDVEKVVKCLLEAVTNSLASGERIEIRGFGSFTLKCREPDLSRCFTRCQKVA